MKKQKVLNRTLSKLIKSIKPTLDKLGISFTEYNANYYDPWVEFNNSNIGIVVLFGGADESIHYLGVDQNSDKEIIFSQDKEAVLKETLDYLKLKPSALGAGR